MNSEEIQGLLQNYVHFIFFSIGSELVSFLKARKQKRDHDTGDACTQEAHTIGGEHPWVDLQGGEEGDVIGEELMEESSEDSKHDAGEHY